MVADIMAYIAVTEAANRLHRSPSSVRRWLRDGRLRGRKVERGGPGGTWQVDEDSCEQLAARLTTEVTAGLDAAATQVDKLTLKDVRELMEAIQELTAELKAQRLLPAPQDEKPPGLLQRAWARLTGRVQNGER